MRIMTLTDPSHPDRENEDAVALGPDLAVVVDGAGLQKSLRQGCSHSVAWYSHALATRCAARLEEDLTMSDALEAAIAAVRDLHRDTCDLPAGSPSGTVAAWRVRSGRLEHLVLADAAILVLRRDGAELITDLRIHDAVTRFRRRIEAAPPEGGRAPTHRGSAGAEEADIPIAYRALEAARNVEDGFWCAHHQPEAAKHSLLGDEAWEDGMTVVAMSDGAARALLDVGTHQPDDFGRLCAEGRLGEICDAVRAAEATSGSRFTKRHDDLTLAVGRS